MMKQSCPSCKSTNNHPADRFCQDCGATLQATTVQGRTLVMPSTTRALPDLDAKTAVQNIRQTYGNTLVMSQDIATMARRNQREQTVIVTDVSSSMGEPYDGGMTKLQAAIRASVVLIVNKAQIDPDDQVGLVAFNSSAEVLQELRPLHSYKREMIQIVQGLTADNGTDINEGLVAARDMLDRSWNNVVHRVVLLTDGQGGEPLATAEYLKSRGVVIDVIGIGDCPSNVNEKLLKAVASTVEGELRYRFIKDHQTLVAHYTQLANKTATSQKHPPGGKRWF